jgi:hypothetical protein
MDGGCVSWPLLDRHFNDQIRARQRWNINQAVEDGFMKTRLPTTIAAAISRIAAIASRKTKMPTANAPNAPMHVQMI